MVNLSKILQRVEKLEPIPSVIHQVLALADDPDAPLQDLVAVVEKDPAITANLLKTVNSAHLGLPVKVDSVQQAVELGFAETPPDLDIEGHDTAHKCQILASLCFSTEVDLDAVYVEGITKVTHSDVAYAREMGYLIKLLAVIGECD